VEIFFFRFFFLSPLLLEHMGNFLSSFFSSEETKSLIKTRLSLASSRFSKLASSIWSYSGAAVWTIVTAGVVLAVPVFFEYERECQLFDQMQQMQAAQMAAAEAAQGGHY
jgi:hypothetical protein